MMYVNCTLLYPVVLSADSVSLDRTAQMIWLVCKSGIIMSFFFMAAWLKKSIDDKKKKKKTCKITQLAKS